MLASRDSSLASAGGDHPPVGVDFVKKSGSVMLLRDLRVKYVIPVRFGFDNSHLKPRRRG